MIKIIGMMILSAASLYFLAGCKQEAGKKNLLPGLAASDSAIVMYYHKPGNPRFFNMTKVYDKSFITGIAEEVNRGTTPPKDTCTTQGKIYFYGQKGVVETIYFSRLRDCMTLSFIKTGEKYFARMIKEIKEQLDELEKKSVSLPVGAE